MAPSAQEQLALLYGQSLDAIFVADRESLRYVFANRRALGLVGYTLDELVQLRTSDLRCADGGAPAGQRERVRQGGLLEETLAAKGGARVPVVLSVWPLTLEGVVHLVASARSIDETQRLVSASQDATMRFQLMFEQSTDALFWEDGAGVILDVNATATELFGVPREWFLGKDGDAMLFERRPREQHLADMAQLQASGRLTFTLELPTASGKQLITELRMTQQETSLGTRRLVAVRDITEQRRSERQLQELQKREAVAALATGVAHEFNNLLAAITCHADIAASVRGGSDDLAAILEAGRRGEKLTRSLLSYARPVASEARPLDVARLVGDFAGILRRSLDLPVEVKVERAAAPLVSEIDPVLFDQVLLNLSLNARDAMPEGGQLTFRVSRVQLLAEEAKRLGGVAGDYACVSVSDEGSGMDAPTLARVFDAFFTTRPGKRSGLGLTVAKALVQQHKGFLAAESSPQKGATFSIYLPRSLQILPAVRTTPVPMPRGRETLLLIEPDDAVRRAAQRALEVLGYSVLAATNPEDARRAMAEEPGLTVALTLADDELPSEALPPGKVLRTASVPPERNRRGVIVKPYTVESLARAVREALGP